MLKNVLLPRVRKLFEEGKRSINRHKEKFTDCVELAMARTNMDTFETVAETHQQVLKLAQKDKGTLILGVKFPPNPNFQGREDILDQLDGYIRRPENGKSEQKMPNSCVVHGMGGVGKTQVALTYLYQHEEHFEYIFWVNSGTGPKIIETFHDFAQVLMPDQVSKNQASSVDLMRGWLKQSK